MAKTLRNGKVKESSREKKLRKKEFQETQKQLYSIVFPTLGVVALFIILYVYLKTRTPSAPYNMDV